MESLRHLRVCCPAVAFVQFFPLKVFYLISIYRNDSLAKVDVNGLHPPSLSHLKQKIEVLYTFILLLQTQWRGFQAAQRLEGKEFTDEDFQDWPGADSWRDWRRVMNPHRPQVMFLSASPKFTETMMLFNLKISSIQVCMSHIRED